MPPAVSLPRFPSPRLLLIALALLAAGPSAGRAGEAAGDEPRPAFRASVRFMVPTASTVAYGGTPVHVSVSPPPGTVTRQVEFFVDGDSLGVDTVPPYRVNWNAGEKMGSHTLRAVAAFSDGTFAEDRITTRGLDLVEFEEVEGRPIEKVELLLSVVDKQENPVTGLTAESFTVKERGKAVRIHTFKPLKEMKTLPLSITVLVDRSGSMRFRMDAWRKACLALLQALRPVDQVRVSEFAHDRFVLQDFTRDARSLAGSLELASEARGDTRLLRALFEEVRDLRDFPGRKAVVVISDALDTEFGERGGSSSAVSTAITGAIERVAGRGGVTIIAMMPEPHPRGLTRLQILASRTGGWWVYGSENIEQHLAAIGNRLLGSYVAAYDTDQTTRPDVKRRVSASLKGDFDPSWTIHVASGRYGKLDLVDALKQDLDEGNAQQRARAARELGRVGAERSATLLTRALSDANPGVRVEVLRTLGRMKDPGTLDDVLDAVRDLDPAVRGAAFESAVQFGSAAVGGLLKITGRGGQQQQGALRALGAIGDPAAVPALEEGMASEDCAVRTAAADGAGYLFELRGGGIVAESEGEESGGALSLLRKALVDVCDAAADAAALALGRLAHPDALPRLVGIMADTTTSSRRPEAILVLSYYLNPETFEAVESYLIGGPKISPESRAAAARLYRSAIRTVRWLGTQQGRGRITDLGVAEAIEVLTELDALGRSTQAGSAWMKPIQDLLSELEEIHPE